MVEYFFIYNYIKVMRIKFNTSSKVNLFLDVIKKREDGFHNIRTVFLEVLLGDTIILEKTNNSNIMEINSNIKELEGKNNLIYNLWIELLKRFNFKNGVRIYLDKKIPIGTGLGSGSGDAAHTLFELEKLFQVSLSKNEKWNIFSKIGSDIPFFIDGGMQIAEGKGEILKPIFKRGEDLNTDSNNIYILVVCPGIRVSTKEAYEKLHIKKDEEKNLVKNRLQIDKLVKGILTRNKKLIRENLYNKFEENIFVKYEEIKEIKNKLIEYGAIGSLLSGSGSSVFGIFFDKDLMNEAYNLIKAKSYKCFMTVPNIKINDAI